MSEHPPQAAGSKEHAPSSTREEQVTVGTSETDPAADRIANQKLEKDKAAIRERLRKYEPHEDHHHHPPLDPIRKPVSFTKHYFKEENKKQFKLGLGLLGLFGDWLWQWLKSAPQAMGSGAPSSKSGDHGGGHH